MVKLVGTKKINGKIASQIETLHSDYKSAYIAMFTNEMTFPDHTFQIEQMDDFSFLDYIHIECESNLN